MDNITSTILIGATGGINSGLLATGVLEKLQLASTTVAPTAILIAGAVGGMVLVAAFRSMVAVLSEIAPQQQLI